MSIKIFGKKVEHVNVEVSEIVILESAIKIMYDVWGESKDLGSHMIDDQGNLCVEYVENWGSHASFERDVIRVATEDDRKYLSAIEMLESTSTKIKLK